MQLIKLDMGEKARKLVFEYAEDEVKNSSEKTDQLNALLDELKINVYFVETVQGFPYEEKPSGWHNKYKVVVKRGDNKMSFNLYGSTADCQTGTPLDLSTLLSCMGSDYYCPDNFDDFCSEFGYDKDGRRAEKIFKASIEQSAKLKQIFTEEEVALFPR